MLLFHFGVRFLSSSSSLRLVPVPLPRPLLFCICVCPFSVCSFFFNFLRLFCPSSYFCLFSSFSSSSYSSFFFLFLFLPLLSRFCFWFVFFVFLLLILCCFFFFLFFSLKSCFPRVICLSVCLLGWSCYCLAYCIFVDFVFSTTGPHPHMLQFRSGHVKIPPVKN